MDEEEKFIFDIIDEWGRMELDACRYHMYDDGVLFRYNQDIEDITQIKRIKNLSLKGKAYFFIKSIESWVTGLKEIVKALSMAEKRNIAKQIQERIKNHSANVIKPVMDLIHNRCFQGEAILSKSDPLYIDLPDEDKDFLIDLLSKDKSESDETIKIYNDWFPMLARASKGKIFRIPPVEEIKELNNSLIHSSMEEIDILLEDIKKEYIKKDLTIGHKIKIIEAKSEIDKIYNFIDLNVDDFATVNQKLKMYEKFALSYITDHPKKFFLVKLKYFKDEKFYIQLKPYFKNRKIKEKFYGWIINRIFEDHGLYTIRTEIIIEEVRNIK